MKIEEWATVCVHHNAQQQHFNLNSIENTNLILDHPSKKKNHLTHNWTLQSFIKFPGYTRVHVNELVKIGATFLKTRKVKPHQAYFKGLKSHSSTWIQTGRPHISSLTTLLTKSTPNPWLETEKFPEISISTRIPGNHKTELQANQVRASNLSRSNFKKCINTQFC